MSDGEVSCGAGVVVRQKTTNATPLSPVLQRRVNGIDASAVRRRESAMTLPVAAWPGAVATRQVYGALLSSDPLKVIDDGSSLSALRGSGVVPKSACAYAKASRAAGSLRVAAHPVVGDVGNQPPAGLSSSRARASPRRSRIHEDGVGHKMPSREEPGASRTHRRWWPRAETRGRGLVGERRESGPAAYWRCCRPAVAELNTRMIFVGRRTRGCRLMAYSLRLDDAEVAPASSPYHHADRRA